MRLVSLLKNPIALGWLAGWVALALLGVSISVRVIAGSVSMVELPEHTIGPIETLLYTALYFTFMNGLRFVAKRYQDTDMEKMVNTIILIGIAQAVVCLPFSFLLYLESEFLLLVFVALLPLVVVNGIALMRLGDSFQKHTDRVGPLARKIAWWNRTSGWMLVSVILLPIGFCAYAVAEFYLWRLLAKEHRPEVPQVPV